MDFAEAKAVLVFNRCFLQGTGLHVSVEGDGGDVVQN